jgi:hypothetical protein
MSRCSNTPNSFINAAQARELARDKSTIYREICAIQQGILEATSLCTVDGGKFCTTVAGTTPMTYITDITSVDVTNGGLDYFPVPATASFYHPDPSFDYTAADATADVTVVNGSVNDINVTFGGTNYSPISATTTVTSTLGAGAVIELDVSGGVIQSATVVSGGTQYAVGDVVNVVHPTGSGASLVVSQTGSPTGEVLVVTVNNGGSGYDTILPRVEINHPEGVNFVGTVQVNGIGEVIGVTITNGGVGYNPLLPTISIDDVSGHGADFQATVDSGTGELTVLEGGAGYTSAATGTVVPPTQYAGSGAELYINAVAGAIDSVTITDGGLKYKTGLFVLEAPTLGTSAHLYLTVDETTGEVTDVRVLDGGTGYVTGLLDLTPVISGSGATVDITVTENPYGTNPYLYYAAFVDAIEDDQKIDQIDQVIQYFTTLGYSITAEVNPATDCTLLWNICW